MPTDKKYGTSRSRKRKFGGNQYTKKPDGIDLLSDVSIGHDEDNDEEGPSTSKSATATRSKQKVEHDIFSEIFEFSDKSDSENDDCESCIDGEEEDELCDEIESPNGNRIIDMTLLCNNIASNLVCRHCQHDVKLIETARKGLASTLAFHCCNRHCNGQPAFSSSPQVLELFS